MSKLENLDEFLDKIKEEESVNNEDQEGRRRVSVRISPEFIGMMARDSGDDCIITSVQSQIPKDAKFIGVNWDFQRDCFYICFEHESFELISYGKILPEVMSTITSYYV